ncbi:hypothetical protein NKH18_04435 [Streptomyces sp. M10(2022)]
MLGIRRWRHNPLRRATDRHEAWLALVALLLMLTAAPALGWVCGSLTDEALQKAVRTQRERRHNATAVVLPGPATSSARLTGDPEVAVDEHIRLHATWQAPDGTARKGTVSTASKHTAPGSRLRIWTDDEGRPVPRPMDMPTAHTHAVLATIGVSLVVAVLIEVTRRLAVWHMMRQRYIRLDQAWARAGPDWGRTGTGF